MNLDDDLLDAPKEQRLNLRYASFYERLVAAIIDGLLIGILLKIIAYFLGIFLNNRIIFGVYWLYHSISESSIRQASLGKQILRLQVTDTEEKPIGFLKAILRNFIKYPAGVIFFIGHFSIFFSSRKQAFHDFIANTLVFKTTSSLINRRTREFRRKKK
ncbi:MAG: RDD family protein [Saprospiraceae bacterium]